MQKQQDNKPPIVMCFSGHDPSGGAGIQADIESINAHHARACTVITALTVQDTQDVQQLIPVELSDFKNTAKTLLNDVSPKVFKTGLLADTDIAQAICEIKRQYLSVPLVVDPVLASGAGSRLSNENLIQTLREKLLPLATIATPNLPEAQIISGEENPDASAEKMLAMGCQHILLTGTHANTKHVVNTLYSQNEKIEFAVERLTGEFHGSGCTLAASLAANLANQHEINNAVKQALDYTWQTLKHAQVIGKGQLLPKRNFSHD